MGKKFIALFLCMSLLVCSALTGCSTNTTADGHEVKIIRVAFNQNEDHPQYKAMRELGDKFEEATNGRYKMVIYPNGVLGEQGSMAEFIRTGALDMAIVPCSVPEGYDSDFAIVGAPYLYDDMDHLRRTTLSGAFDELFKSTRKFNFEVLTVYTAGERNIYANKPINTPDDLKGMIVRVNDSTTYLNMVKSWVVLVQQCHSQRFTQHSSRVLLMQERTVREYIQTLSIMKLLSIIHTQSILFILM